MENTLSAFVSISYVQKHASAQKLPTLVNTPSPYYLQRGAQLRGAGTLRTDSRTLRPREISPAFARLFGHHKPAAAAHLNNAAVQRSDRMADAVDSPQVPLSDDRILRAWSKVRSSLHESEHRFNSRYAERYYAGANADPQEGLDYFETMYEPAVEMSGKTVTPHQSRRACFTQPKLPPHNTPNLY